MAEVNKTRYQDLQRRFQIRESKRESYWGDLDKMAFSIRSEFEAFLGLDKRAAWVNRSEGEHTPYVDIGRWSDAYDPEFERVPIGAGFPGEDEALTFVIRLWLEAPNNPSYRGSLDMTFSLEKSQDTHFVSIYDGKAGKGGLNFDKNRPVKSFAFAWDDEGRTILTDAMHDIVMERLKLSDRIDSEPYEELAED
ncbi:hypothetical protein [Salinicola socius]|uniref:Uncharacterized protein n=1 Tax=Salinicola socius TaxID=404433 RepID=A0A1Q8SV07_9GAMM|nr:hypothetical protein [Salinicola socius]OLO05285.1 hypothetical protein BTW07_04450 [Salinicola socius]